MNRQVALAQINEDIRKDLTKMNNDSSLRHHLVRLMRGQGAHLPYEPGLFSVSVKLRGAKKRGIPYSPWQLLEHMRIAQWDIYQFCVNPDHESPEWPAGYWPTGNAPPNRTAWAKSVRGFFSDLDAMEILVLSPKTNLFEILPHGTGQTILREALLLADHNAYHSGQFVALLRALGAWKTK